MTKPRQKSPPSIWKPNQNLFRNMTKSSQDPASSPFGRLTSGGGDSLFGQQNAVSSGGLFGNFNSTPIQTSVPSAGQEEIYRWIRDEIKACRGTELKGTLNPDVLPLLFHKQVRKWRQISESHFLTVRTITVNALVQLFESVCTDPLTRQRMEQSIKDVNLQSKSQGLSKLLDRIDNISAKHLQTSNPAFEQKVSEARKMRFDAAIKRYMAFNGPSVNPLNPPNPRADNENYFHVIDMRDTAALFAELHMSNSQNLEDEVHDTLQAYYEVARENFIEYVNQHIVEPYLDDPQGPVMFFSPMYVAGLDNQKIESLAAEDQALVENRESKREALSRLNRAKEIAEKYTR